MQAPHTPTWLCAGVLPVDIVGVVSNHEDCRPLVEFHGIPFHCLPVTPATKRRQEAQLLELIERERVDLLVLARYMQILSDGLCELLKGRAINIHHSFLPGFKGARPYHQAHARGVKVIGGEITLGQLAQALAFMLILQMPVRQIGWMINSIARASTCGGRLFNVLDLTPSIADAPDARPLDASRGALRFEDVDFRYPTWAKDGRTLSGISFEARPGKMIGIVGPPGAGKTTIAQLIGRYYDVTAGRITIDGQDIRGVTLTSLRAAVSIVQQEPFLFTASIDRWPGSR